VKLRIFIKFMNAENYSMLSSFTQTNFFET